MSTIEERIVNMRFNNAEFEAKARSTQRTLQDLNRSLNFDGAKTGLNDLAGVTTGLSAGAFASLAATAEAIADKFRVMGVVGITAIAGITTAALHAGTALIKSLTIDPIKTGLQEYETQLNAVQTILSNTSFKGETIETVNAALDELNRYADLTIYNFSEMARNIGTFTAAGVGLQTSVDAIKGIANLAALSGSSSQQASTAMYQLSQALAGGTVRLMDWNSVVNAGMGGEVFQNAIKETARAHGVAVDDIIAKNGSFRDSLQDGWLTADILLETLSKFTGDLTDDQLRAMGYTEQQIVDIQKLGDMASDAATKVKTATQLIGTLRESAQSGWAQTWRIIFGDFLEARELWTSVYNVLGGMISASADARNNMLMDWEALGGRTDVITAIGNAFKFVMAVLKPIRTAFRNIFPAVTAQQLYDITHTILEFTEGLKVSGSVAQDIRRTFQGFFAVLDIGRMIVVGVVKMLANLLGFLFEGSAGFLDMTGDVGAWLVTIRDAIKEGEGLNKFFEVLENVLKAPIVALKVMIAFIATLGESFRDMVNGGGATFEDFAERLKARLEPLAVLGEFFAKVWEKVWFVLKKVIDFFAPIGAIFGQMFLDIGDSIGKAIRGGGFDSSVLLDLFNAGLITGLIIMIKDFVESLRGIADTASTIKGAITGILNELTETLQVMQGKIKADTIFKIAASVALLAASVLVLSLIDPIKLTAALGAITVMMLQLVGMMALFVKIKPTSYVGMTILSANMILLAAAIGVLAASVALLGQLEWDSLLKGLLGVIVLMGVMVGAAKLMSSNSAGVLTSSVVLILMAGALRIMASALAEISKLSWEEIAKGLTGVAGIMAAFVAFTRLVGDPKRMFAVGVGLLLMATAIRILAGALVTFSSMSWEELAKGILAFAATMAILVLAMKFLQQNIGGAVSLVIAAAALLILGQALNTMAKLSWDDIGRVIVIMVASLVLLALFLAAMGAIGPVALLGAAALVASAFALVVIAGALIILSKLSWDDIGRITVTLLAVLGILAVGLTLMIAALPGAAAMVVVAGALAVLAPILLLFGKMSWDEIGRGLAMLAGTFAVIGIAGLLLAPVVPILLLLGVALVLMGTGAFLAGVGIFALSLGITALALAGQAGMATLVTAATVLIGLIPLIAKNIALGIVSLIQTLAESISGIVGAIVIIGVAILDAMIQLIPKILEFASLLIHGLVDFLVDMVPFLYDAGLKMLTGILQGMADNIEPVTKAAGDVASAFVKAMAKEIPEFAQDVIDAVIKLMDAVGDLIDTNAARLGAAGGRLARAFFDGFVLGIGGFLVGAFNAGERLGEEAVKGAKKGAKSHSPSEATKEIGGWMGEGLIIGLLQMMVAVGKAGKDVGAHAVDTMQSAISRASDVINGNIEMSPTIRPVLDLSDIKNNAALISGIIGTPKLPVTTSYDLAAEVMNDRLRQEEDAYNGDDDEPRGGDTNYYQYITSPKAISAAEVYRNTKNLVSKAKEDANVGTP